MSKRTCDKIAEGLEEALAIARGEAAPVRLHVPSEDDACATASSGNVFADLGLPNAVENKTKVRLALVINRVLEEQGLLQKDAAKLFGCTQPEVSALANYKLRGLSVIRLMEFLTALDRDVEIGIRRIQGHGHIRVQELEPA